MPVLLLQFISFWDGQSYIKLTVNDESFDNLPNPNIHTTSTSPITELIHRKRQD